MQKKETIVIKLLACVIAATGLFVIVISWRGYLHPTLALRGTLDVICPLLPVFSMIVMIIPILTIIVGVGLFTGKRWAWVMAIAVLTLDFLVGLQAAIRMCVFSLNHPAPEILEPASNTIVHIGSIWPTYTISFIAIVSVLILLQKPIKNQFVKQGRCILKKNYANLFSLVNIIVLIITLCVLLRYAYDTNRIAGQTQEQNLRPVILRSGYVKSWDDVRSRTFKSMSRKEIFDLKSKKLVEIEKMPDPLQFKINKNIATDINGFVVIDGYKYILVFSHQMTLTQINEKVYLTEYEKNWGWMDVNTFIFALIDEKNAEITEEKNKIRINYKDIEGNKYYTIEDKDFSQKSFSE